MQLYIIRHAQSTNNALADQRDRVKDPDLTELGYSQAEIVAQHLATGINPEQVVGVSEEDTHIRSRKGFGLTRLYCSAMYRSLLTAQPIGRALGLTPEVWVDIHEHGGIFLDHQDERGVVGYPGRTRSEILADFPGYNLPEEITEAGWWDPQQGKEDWPACQGRAIKVANKLRQCAGSDERIGMVSHGGFIDVLLKALLNQLPRPNIFYHHYNTAITRIDFRPAGPLDIRYINRVGHLPPELVS